MENEDEAVAAFNRFRDWEIENFGPDPQLFPEEAKAFRELDTNTDNG